jgi:hypothetical protein
MPLHGGIKLQWNRDSSDTGVYEEPVHLTGMYVYVCIYKYTYVYVRLINLCIHCTYTYVC